MFPNAPRAESHRRWRRIKAGFLAAPGFRLWQCVIGVVILSPFGALLVIDMVEEIGSGGTLREALANGWAFLSPGFLMILGATVLLIYMTVTHVVFRIRHGCAPTPENVEELL